MNIIEALEAVKNGHIVRASEKKEVHFVLEGTLMPFGDKARYEISLDNNSNLDAMPLNMEEISYEELRDRVCLRYIESTNYSIVTEEEMLHEIQDYWKLQNEEDDTENEDENES